LPGPRGLSRNGRRDPFQQRRRSGPKPGRPRGVSLGSGPGLREKAAGQEFFPGPGRSPKVKFGLGKLLPRGGGGCFLFGGPGKKKLPRPDRPKANGFGFSGGFKAEGRGQGPASDLAGFTVRISWLQNGWALDGACCPAIWDAFPAANLLKGQNGGPTRPQKGRGPFGEKQRGQGVGGGGPKKRSVREAFWNSGNKKKKKT